MGTTVVEFVLCTSIVFFPSRTAMQQASFRALALRPLFFFMIAPVGRRVSNVCVLTHELGFVLIEVEITVIVAVP